MIDYRDFDRDVNKVLDFMLEDLKEKDIWKN